MDSAGHALRDALEGIGRRGRSYPNTRRLPCSKRDALLGDRFTKVLVLVVLLSLHMQVQAATQVCFSGGITSPSLNRYWQPVSLPIPTKANNHMLHDMCSGSLGSIRRICTAKHMFNSRLLPSIWRVNICSLPDFRVECCSQALGNRTIWLIGDSVTQQHKMRLQCLLQNSDRQGGFRVQGLRVSHADHFEALLKKKGR
jgi:hypothetical protein